MDKKVQDHLNNILEMNIQGKFFVNFRTLRPGWVDEDGGYCHGITGTFFECVMWVIDYFDNNNYIPGFIDSVITYLNDWGVPDKDASYIGTMWDDNEPDEEYYVYIRKVVGE